MSLHLATQAQDEPAGGGELQIPRETGGYHWTAGECNCHIGSQFKMLAVYGCYGQR
jgi:hypothetical protein